MLEVLNDPNAKEEALGPAFDTLDDSDDLFEEFLTKGETMKKNH